MNHTLVDKMTLPDEARLAARLERTFRPAWRSYRRAFKRCQKKSSRANVHQLRVETRRLLALVDLFDPLLAGDAAERVSRLFKQPFKTSGRLRDAQVMLCAVERRLARFPDAKRFKKELLRREKRLGQQQERKLRRTRLKPLKNRMDTLRKELHAAVKQPEGRHRALGSFAEERGPGVCERGGAAAEHCPDKAARGSSHARCLQEIPLHGRAVEVVDTRSARRFARQTARLSKVDG